MIYRTQQGSTLAEFFNAYRLKTINIIDSREIYRLMEEV